MSQDFKAGDYLVFQLESGYGLLRILHIDDSSIEPVWHLAAYNEFFPDVDSAEIKILSGAKLSLAIKHAAITDRAFLSTQSSRLINIPLVSEELVDYNEWKNGKGEVFDRSIRLMMGFR